jgi:hypothetical protein
VSVPPGRTNRRDAGGSRTALLGPGVRSHRRPAPAIQIADEPDDSAPELRALSFRPLPGERDPQASGDGAAAPADEAHARDARPMETALDDEDPAALALAASTDESLAPARAPTARRVASLHLALLALGLLAVVALLSHRGAAPSPKAPPPVPHGALRAHRPHPARPRTARRPRSHRSVHRRRRTRTDARERRPRTTAPATFAPSAPDAPLIAPPPPSPPAAVSPVEREFGFEGHS